MSIQRHTAPLGHNDWHLAESRGRHLIVHDLPSAFPGAVVANIFRDCALLPPSSHKCAALHFVFLPITRRT